MGKVTEIGSEKSDVVEKRGKVVELCWRVAERFIEVVE